MLGYFVLALTFLLLGAGQVASAQSGPAEVAATHSRTVLITGSSRGIGLEFARQYSAAGWSVIGTARKPDWVKTDLGGPQAPLQAEDSVRGMLGVIDRLSPADNGTFRTYSGEQMAW